MFLKPKKKKKFISGPIAIMRHIVIFFPSKFLLLLFFFFFFFYLSFFQFLYYITINFIHFISSTRTNSLNSLSPCELNAGINWKKLVFILNSINLVTLKCVVILLLQFLLRKILFAIGDAVLSPVNCRRRSLSDLYVSPPTHINMWLPYLYAIYCFWE